MRLRFDSSTGDDDGAFAAARDALLEEFDGWLTERGEHDDGSLVGAAALLLDWRFAYSTGELDRYQDWEVGEFLVEWCPRKYSAPADSAYEVCRGVARFVEFMADTGRLVGGARRAGELVAITERAAPPMFRAMGDPSNFGMAKSLFAGAFDQVSSIDDPDELRRILDQRMADFNALPFDERHAITDPGLERLVDPRSAALPFVHIPPPQGDVVARATSSGLLGQIATLRDYLGGDGKALTERGNLKLADGEALVGLLGTDDRFDESIGDRTFTTRSSAELPGLRFVVDLAKQAGAVRVNRRRLVPVKAWATRDAVDQAVATFHAAAKAGPLGLSFGGNRWVLQDVIEVIDDGLVHWLTMLLPGWEVPFDEVVSTIAAVVAEVIDVAPPFWTEERIAGLAERYLARTVDVLERLNVIEWDGRVEEVSDIGVTDRRGGTLRLTALGRYALPDLATDAGYRIRTIGSLADADVEQLLDAFDEVADEQVEALVATWQPTVAVGRRAEQVADAIVGTTDPRRRLSAMVVFEALGAEESEPYVRRLLDSPVAGHAALWLMAHDLGDDESLRPLVGVGVMVDVLAATLDDPEELCELFLGSPTTHDAEHALSLMWRHDAPETGAVLDALGKHLPDRRLAKAARKAALPAPELEREPTLTP